MVEKIFKNLQKSPLEASKEKTAHFARRTSLH
jgi:hypothetical protein